MKKKFAAVDIARYVSAVLVVCIHTFPLIDFSDVLHTYFLQTVCRIAVPFFFVFSAFFYFRKDPDDEALKRYLWRVGKLYLIWTVIYLPYTLWNYGAAGFSLLGLLSWIRDFFFNGSYYHLWFLPALMWGMVILHFLNKKLPSSTVFLVVLLLYVLGYMINVWATVWEKTPVIYILYGFFTKTLVTARDGFFFAPLYLWMGMALAKFKKLRPKVSAIGLFISWIGLILEVSLYRSLGILQDSACMFLFLIPLVYFLCSLLVMVKMPWKPVYGQLRKESLLIYTSHILFARILFLIFPDSHMAVFFFTMASSQAFASLVCAHLKQYPALQALV